MLIISDNDVIGAVAVIRRILESALWRESAAGVELNFAGLDAIDLLPDAPDQRIWEACQAVGAVLITANRASGQNSLDEVIRSVGGIDSLPVMTIADPQRLVADRAYAERTSLALLDYLERIDSLRGTGRLFIP